MNKDLTKILLDYVDYSTDLIADKRDEVEKITSHITEIADKKQTLITEISDTEARIDETWELINR